MNVFLYPESQTLIYILYRIPQAPARCRSWLPRCCHLQMLPSCLHCSWLASRGSCRHPLNQWTANILRTYRRLFIQDVFWCALVLHAWYSSLHRSWEGIVPISRFILLVHGFRQRCWYSGYKKLFSGVEK